MADEFLHGIKIIREDAEPRPVDPAKMTTIGLIGTGGVGVDVSVWPLDKPLHVFTDEVDKIAKLGIGGTLREAFDAIIDQGIIASVVVVRVAAGASEAATLANVVGSSAARTGVHALRIAAAELGIEPTILIAPAFTHQRVVNGVVSIAVTDGGQSYTAAMVTITGVGTGAKAEAVISGGAITAITVINPGLGYAEASTIVTIIGDGTGAEADAVIGSAANPVIAELLPIADQLMAVIIADGPNTTREAAEQYRQDWNSERLIIVDPAVLIYREGATAPSVQVASARIAGLGVKRDKEKGGPFWSWSNQPIGGAVGVARPISYYISDPDSEANFLNAHQIATLYREVGDPSGGAGGILFWGNESATSDPLWRFYNVRRGRDFIHKSILRTFKTFLGRYNLDRHTILAIVESVDAFIRDLKAAGKILDGRAYLEASVNSPEQLRLGKLRVEFAVEEPAPLQTLIFGSRRYRIAYDLLIQDVIREIEQFQLAA
jgi:phage tail sheath protein FI